MTFFLKQSSSVLLYSMNYFRPLTNASYCNKAVQTPKFDLLQEFIKLQSKHHSPYVFLPLHYFMRVAIDLIISVSNKPECYKHLQNVSYIDSPVRAKTSLHELIKCVHAEQNQRSHPGISDSDYLDLKME